MSCSVGSVNRALSVLAAIWAVVPLVGAATLIRTGGAEDAAPPGLSSAALPDPPREGRPERPVACDEAPGQPPTRCTAAAQPNRKNARVTHGR
jgi:hypothetical protein